MNKEQIEPVYQTLISSPDGFWRDCDKDTLKFNADSGWLTRTLFTSPPEVAELLGDTGIGVKVYKQEVPTNV